MLFVHQAIVAGCWQKLDELVKNSFPNDVAERDTLPMDINWPLYEELQTNKVLILSVARDGVDLFGFATYFIMHNLHHKTLLFAHCDFLVTHVDHQGEGIGTKLIKFSEQVLRGRGVNYVVHNFRTLYKDGVVPLFARLGYKLDEQCYRKQLQ